MGKLQKHDKEPGGSIITRKMSGRIDYVDSYSINVNSDKAYSVDYLTAVLFTSIPVWLTCLMKVRNFLVKPFGIEAGIIPEMPKIERSVHYNIGDRAVLFAVTDRSESEIVMAEDDIHLYFRTSVAVMDDSSVPGRRMYFTTLVQFHNKLGRFYFFPVKPFHVLIIKSMLVRLSKTLN